MRGPSRAAAGTAWVGRPAGRETAKARPCPQCPAEPWNRCLNWVSESYTTETEGFVQGDGRWSPMQTMHYSRVSPGSLRAKPIIDAGQRPCSNTDRHPYHWHDDPRTWCRGRL